VGKRVLQSTLWRKKDWHQSSDSFKEQWLQNVPTASRP
jgi:hypothetical protein